MERKGLCAVECLLLLGFKLLKTHVPQMYRLCGSKADQSNEDLISSLMKEIRENPDYYIPRTLEVGKEMNG